jgi:hypothetical protein
MSIFLEVVETHHSMPLKLKNLKLRKTQHSKLELWQMMLEIQAKLVAEDTTGTKY